MPDNLAKRFDSYVNRLGITKANVLRSWIKSPPKTLQLLPLGKAFTNGFTVILQNPEFELLQQNAARWGLDVSTYTRVLITTCLQHEMGIGSPNLQADWKLQDNVVIEVDPEQCDLATLVRMAQHHLRLGAIDKASVELDIFEAKALSAIADEQTWGSYYLHKGQLARVRRNFKSASHMLKRAQTVGLKFHDKNLLGVTSYQQSVIAWINNNIEESLRLVHKAVEYYDPIQHKLELAEAYQFLARIYMPAADKQLAMRYLQLAGQSISGVKDLHLQAQIDNTQGCVMAMQGDYVAAEKSLQNSLNINQSNSSLLHLFYNWENLGKLALAQGRFDQAVQYLQQARQLEFQVRPGDQLSIAAILLKLIEQKDRYAEVRKDLHSMIINNTHQRNQVIATTVLAAGDYLFGDAELAKLGEMKLKQNSDKYQDVSARYILINKIIPFLA